MSEPELLSVAPHETSPVLGVIGIMLLTWYCIHLYYMFTNFNEPVPYGAFVPFFGCIVQLSLWPEAFLKSCKSENGIFNLYFLGITVTMVTSEEHFTTVYKKLSFYPALSIIQIDKILGPHAIPYKANDFMRLIRTKLVPQFFNSPDVLYEPMLREFDRIEQRFNFGEHTTQIDDVFAIMTRTMLVMNVYATMGSVLGQDEDFIDDLCAWQDVAKKVIRRPSILGIRERSLCDTIRHRLIVRVKQEVEEFLDTLTHAHAHAYAHAHAHAHGHGHGRAKLVKYSSNSSDEYEPAEQESNEERTFLQHFVMATKDDPEWNLDLVAEKLLGLAYGSVANTPMAAANTLMHLLKDDSDVLQRVMQEVDMAYRIGGGKLTSSAVFSMELTSFCIEESIRLIGPPVHVRIADRDVRLSSTSTILPKGRLVGISTYLIHRDSEYFPDHPNKFYPDRFRKEQNRSSLQRRRSSVNALHPMLLNWGRGHHLCYGRQLAHCEIKMIIAHMLHTYRMKLNARNNDNLEFLTTGCSMFSDRSMTLTRLEHSKHHAHAHAHAHTHAHKHDGGIEPVDQEHHHHHHRSRHRGHVRQGSDAA